MRGPKTLPRYCLMGNELAMLSDWISTICCRGKRLLHRRDGSKHSIPKPVNWKDRSSDNATTLYVTKTLEFSNALTTSCFQGLLPAAYQKKLQLRIRMLGNREIAEISFVELRS